MTEIEQVNLILKESESNIEAIVKLQKLRIKHLERILVGAYVGWALTILVVIIGAFILKMFF